MTVFLLGSGVLGMFIFMRKRAKKTGIMLCIVMMGIASGFTSQVEAFTFLTTPAWEIGLNDYGYSDFLYDLRPSYEEHEYLSGEWGAQSAIPKGRDH